MRAAVLEGVNDIKVHSDVEIDKPSVGEVLVRVHNCGVCHSDLHFVDGSLPTAYPAILGHEAGGIVEAVGQGVTGLAEGDKVILTLRPPCGRCYYCVRGEFSICPQYADMSGVLPDGGTRLSHQGRTVTRAGVFLAAFAEQAVVPATGAVKVDDDTPLDIASVIGCAVQTGVGAVLNTAKVEPGATVMIIGLGGIGISIAQGARIAGASRVIGVDYAFDAVGNNELVQTCIAATRQGGTTVMVGVPRIDQFVNIHAILFAMSEKKLQGCFLGSSNPHREFPRLLSLWRSGKLDLEAMVTARRPLDEIDDAFADMKAGVGLRTVLSLT